MKALTIAMLLLISTSLHAGPYFRAEAGTSTDDRIYFTDLTVGYRFTFYGIVSDTYGGTRTWAYYNLAQFSGQPFEDVYTWGQKITYGRYFMHLKHYCAHKVISKASESRSVAPDWWSGEITTFSIGMEFEAK